MRILVTADWQARFSNLAQCQRTAARITTLIKEHRLEAVVVAGDLKDQYNPLDVRVLRFWRDFVQSIRIAGAMPVLLLGNHDRTALSHSEMTWFPSLEDAGAVTYEAPGICTMSAGRLFMLPFSANAKAYAAAAKELAEAKPEPEHDVLVFHETFHGASWDNVSPLLVEASEGYGLSRLYPNRYLYMLGGDIHKRQQLRKNAWYVGSPFPHSWNECNQTKHFALVLDGKLSWVPTGEPGWYDPAVREFRPPEKWDGARVRITVPVAAGESFGEALVKERAKAEGQFPGAQVTVRPFRVDETKDTVRAQDLNAPEKEQIREFLEETVPEADREAMRAYVDYRLAATGAVARSHGDVKFQRVTARNFLCFEELELDLAHPGITVVTGTNHDRPGKSNGAGKTSLLSTLPTALFGRTFKGQQYDQWARRGAKKAFVSLEFETAAGQRLYAERTRKPSSVRLLAGPDREDISAGGKQAAVSRDIEEACGFSWETFGATVFLSQEEIGAFLWGTPKERHEVIARLQNLERFELAWEAAGQALRREETALSQMEAAAADARSRMEAVEKVSGAAEELRRARETETAASAEYAAAKKAVPPEPDFARRDRAWDRQTERADVLAAATAAHTAAARALEQFRNAPTECPVCEQPVPQDPEARARHRKELDAKMTADEAALTKARKRARKAEKAYKEADRKLQKKISAHGALKATARAARKARKKARKAVSRWEAKAAVEAQEVGRWRRTLETREKAAAEMRTHRDFLKLAVKTLARKGLPAYLMQRLVPRLNAAADRYSDLFTDGELRVQFRIEDGLVKTDVVNPYGGEGVRDQSAGEGRVAALITSFALRYASGRSNVLILDEPGAGLDAESYRAFAEGLREVARQGAVYVVTHDSELASRLDDARRLHVEKRLGVAKLVT